ncbi:hypothetical protein ACFRNT_33120 [Streptomyces sp. NPDC056697]|uniref:hypothetical protein n=1 Tax=Streptomyces sp. NPDC056697 TaxID=3345915 RepID=UPI00369659F5
MTDLRALFSSNDPIDASEAFTNRQHQWEFVATALEEHLRHVTAAGFDPADLEAPRTHLIVFPWRWRRRQVHARAQARGRTRRHPAGSMG